VENQTDRTAQYLRDAILAGDLRPNKMLVAAEIAATLGVSRTPVREALQRLIQEGYATKLSNGFCVVAEHPASEMRESLEVETHLLKLAARLACERGTADPLRAMEELCDHMDQAIGSERLDDWMSAAGSWVDTLVTLSGNGVLVSAMDSLRVHYWRRRWSRFVRLADCKEMTERYREVSDAVRTGDAERAERVIDGLGRTMSRFTSMWFAETGSLIEPLEK
jgi:DNA-binding GntR family transcriptional regulator